MVGKPPTVPVALPERDPPTVTKGLCRVVRFPRAADVSGLAVVLNVYVKAFKRPEVPSSELLAMYCEHERKLAMNRTQSEAIDDPLSYSIAIGNG
mmetsp:Transcript_10363/g.11798  ORF Transcript_10363/g.11798 Transcript_10363/m.11798 type:complete len:95 (+) Transcript_10363:360-644(+)